MRTKIDVVRKGIKRVDWFKVQQVYCKVKRKFSFLHHSTKMKDGTLILKNLLQVYLSTITMGRNTFYFSYYNIFLLRIVSGIFGVVKKQVI